MLASASRQRVAAKQERPPWALTRCEKIEEEARRRTPCTRVDAETSLLGIAPLFRSRLAPRCVTLPVAGAALAFTPASATHAQLARGPTADAVRAKCARGQRPIPRRDVATFARAIGRRVGRGERRTGPWCRGPCGRAECTPLTMMRDGARDWRYAHDEHGLNCTGRVAGRPVCVCVSARTSRAPQNQPPCAGGKAYR